MLHELDKDLLAVSRSFDRDLELAVVVPTFNESQNVPELIRRLREALGDIAWELIIVDDDSPDGTSEVVRQFASSDRRIRLIHRVGRRGLSSACVEGMLATLSPYVAVMDADLQHDETILPAMLQRAHEEELDVVVATRNSEGGSMGSFAAGRVLLSRLGRRASRSISRCVLTDPMSGFFLLRRNFLLEVVHRLNGGGFKILLDMISSCSRPVRAGEVGYRFGMRRFGESKLDIRVGFDYIALIIDKLSGGLISSRFLAFSFIGALGILVHFTSLSALLNAAHMHFVSAQAIATSISMVFNFFLHDLITFRDRKLAGWNMIIGMTTFCAGCSFGACANVSFADTLMRSGFPWYLAALGGIAVSTGWNYSISTLLAWRRPQSRRLSPSPAYTRSMPLG